MDGSGFVPELPRRDRPKSKWWPIPLLLFWILRVDHAGAVDPVAGDRVTPRDLGIDGSLTRRARPSPGRVVLIATGPFVPGAGAPANSSSEVSRVLSRRQLDARALRRYLWSSGLSLATVQHRVVRTMHGPWHIPEKIYVPSCHAWNLTNRPQYPNRQNA